METIGIIAIIVVFGLIVLATMLGRAGNAIFPCPFGFRWLITPEEARALCGEELQLMKIGEVDLGFQQYIVPCPPNNEAGMSAYALAFNNNDKLVRVVGLFEFTTANLLKTEGVKRYRLIKKAGVYQHGKPDMQCDDDGLPTEFVNMAMTNRLAADKLLDNFGRECAWGWYNKEKRGLVTLSLTYYDGERFELKPFCAATVMKDQLERINARPENGGGTVTFSYEHPSIYTSPEFLAAQKERQRAEQNRMVDVMGDERCPPR